MQCDMHQWHLVDDWQQLYAFLRTLLPKAHLDGELHLGPLPHLTGNLLHPLGVLQQPASATGLHLHRERTAHIEVYASPSKPLHHVAQPCELFAILGNHLRHRRHTGIGCGVDIPQILLPYLAFLYPHKGRVILVHPADALPVRPPVDRVGIPLQRCESDVHIGHFTIGLPAFCQASMPPSRLYTVQPLAASCSAALRLRLPPRQ